MIPVPRGPGDIPPGPETTQPKPRGGEPLPLAFQALDEIEAIKRSLAEFVKRIEALEHRVAALETAKA